MNVEVEKGQKRDMFPRFSSVLSSWALSFKGNEWYFDTTARPLRTYMMKRRMDSIDGSYKPGFDVAKRWAMCTAQGLAYLHGRTAPILGL